MHNPGFQTSGLHNRYWALRHGESEANVQGLIVSTHETGVHRWGITDRGRDQVRASLEQLPPSSLPPIVLCSDFLRTRQTAKLTAELLQAEPPSIDTRLRERFFGQWEGTRHGNYHLAWEQDAMNPDHTKYGVESVHQVLQRMMSVVKECEQRWKQRSLILVSHGDPLQILQTAFSKRSPAHHRSLPLLAPGELRCLTP